MRAPYWAGPHQGDSPPVLSNNPRCLSCLPCVPVLQLANARQLLHTLAMLPSHHQQSHLPVSRPSSPNTGEEKTRNAVVSFGPGMIPLSPGPFYSGHQFQGYPAVAHSTQCWLYGFAWIVNQEASWSLGHYTWFSLWNALRVQGKCLLTPCLFFQLVIEALAQL